MPFTQNRHPSLYGQRASWGLSYSSRVGLIGNVAPLSYISCVPVHIPLRCILLSHCQAQPFHLCLGQMPDLRVLAACSLAVLPQPRTNTCKPYAPFFFLFQMIIYVTDTAKRYALHALSIVCYLFMGSSSLSHVVTCSLPFSDPWVRPVYDPFSLELQRVPFCNSYISSFFEESQ